MQMMALHAGGRLDQFMPDTTPTHREHWDAVHEVRSLDGAMLSGGAVHSRHKQAVSHPGSLATLAVAHDGVIEAVHDPARRFYIGVQWHPERTGDGPLGLGLFARLIAAAR
jgi:putative glutamine amidotransferase